MSMFNVPLSDEQTVTHLLARRLYVHYSEHRNKEPKSPPFVPEWAQAYAELAVTYLGYDTEAIDRLTQDYK